MIVFLIKSKIVLKISIFLIKEIKMFMKIIKLKKIFRVKQQKNNFLSKEIIK